MRNFPRNSTVTVQIFRSPVTGGVEKYPAVPNATVEANLLPYYRRGGPHSVEGGMFVIEYELYFVAPMDVRRSDELVISSSTDTSVNGKTFYVRTLINQSMGTTPFIVAYISTAA
jgi:hypothetical protein